MDDNIEFKKDDCISKKFGWKKDKNSGDDGMRYKVDCTINYECKNDTHLIGEETGTCSDSGNWGDIPICGKSI